MATKKKTIKKTMPFVIVRGKSSGVHAGFLVEHRPQDGVVVLCGARRIWQWSGAASLSELAVRGAKNRDGCRFAVVVDHQEIVGNDACEIIHCSPAGQKMIQEQPEWRA